MVEKGIRLLHQGGGCNVEQHHRQGIGEAFLCTGHGSLITLKLRIDEGYDRLVIHAFLTSP